ncbi:MAG: hypothetical protein R2788_27295 [Saprospiraceae bacterium]
MNPIVRNILAVVVGVVVGSIVNMALVNIGPMVIPPPEGGDITTVEGLKETMHLFQPKHFIFPFLAHALGTLTGAFIAAIIAVSRKMNMAIGIGAFFLLGGIYMVTLVPSPTWFTILDLVGAYIPMGYLGGRWAVGKNN